MADDSLVRAWWKRLRGELEPKPFPFADAAILESPLRGHAFYTSTWRAMGGADA